MTTNGSPSHYLKLSEKVTQTESFISTEVVFDPKSMFGKKKNKAKRESRWIPTYSHLNKKSMRLSKGLAKKKRNPNPPPKKT